MRYSIAAILALATAVLAQTPGFDVISKPANMEKVPAASTYTIVWDPKPEHDGTVTLSLIGGKDQQSLQPLGTIGKAQNSDGKFSWDVAKTLGDQAIYGIQITWDSDATVFQYSFPFAISPADGGSGPSGSVSSTPSSNSTVSKTSSPGFSSTPISNSTTTAHTSQLTSLSTSTTSSPATTRTNPPTPTSGNSAAPSVGSTLALFGGLVMALFAL